MHFRCNRCPFTTPDLGDFLDHHDLAHDNPIPVAEKVKPTPYVGFRRASDPYYAARDNTYDPDRYDREILAERHRTRDVA